MVLKNTETAIRKEGLGGSGIGGGDMFYVPIPDQNGAFAMAARIEIDPGSSIGYHKHSENEEVYFILSGNAIYTEEEETYGVRQGDVLLCRMGRSHGIKNTGKEKLVLCAAIAKK